MKPNDRFKNSTSGFVTALYEAYVRADSGNSRRIEVAFPHFFEPNDFHADLLQPFIDRVRGSLSNEMEEGKIQCQVSREILNQAIDNLSQSQAESMVGGVHPVDVIVNVLRDQGETVDEQDVEQARAIRDEPVSRIITPEQFGEVIREVCEGQVETPEQYRSWVFTATADANRVQPVDVSRTAAGCAARFKSNGPVRYRGYPEIPPSTLDWIFSLLPSAQDRKRLHEFVLAKDVLLEKYMRHVTQCEGISFVTQLHDTHIDVHFTEDEVKQLKEINKVIIANVWLCP